MYQDWSIPSIWKTSGAIRSRRAFDLATILSKLGFKTYTGGNDVLEKLLDKHSKLTKSLCHPQPILHS
jgi:hypothetical protein